VLGAQGSLAIPSTLLLPHHRQLIEKLSGELKIGELSIEDFRTKANIDVKLIYSVFQQALSS